MNQHGQRSHATWAASASARLIHCAGSLALTLSLPRVARVEREAAAWGTCAHQIAEQCLRHDYDAVGFIGETETCGSYSFTVDEEMANTSQVYVNYCRELMRTASWYVIEQQFSLESLDPPFDSGGTGDFVAYLADEKMLEIVDLKGGKGVVVEAEANDQERTYGLGAMLAFPGHDIRKIKTTIVQPRAPHKSGIIRSEIFSVGELVEWTTDLLAAMGRSNEALEALGVAQGNQVLLDEWRDAWLRPGRCQFCPAEGVCPALRNDALSIVNKWFEADPVTGEPDFKNAPLETSPEALARDLDLMDQLQNWMNARRQFAQQLAESGVAIPNYQLVDKRGTRRWLNTSGRESEHTIALRISEATGLPDKDLWAIKLKSPAQVEKLLPAKQHKRIEPLWEMHVSGTNLVRSDKTTRPAVGGLAQRWHDTNPMED